MELVTTISVIITIISVLTSYFIVKRVKKQISEMSDTLADVKTGNPKRRINTDILYLFEFYFICFICAYCAACL